MQPAADDTTVELLIVSHRNGATVSTDCDEAIACALEEELAAAGDASSVPGSKEGATDASRSGGRCLAAAAGLAADAARSDSQPPSAPPLPAAQADAALLTDDERLARSLHDQELRNLLSEQREHLTNLPALLTDSPLVHTLSVKLLRSLPLTKLLPQVNSSSAVAGGPGQHSSMGRARLEARLALYCLVERKVKGDGACQFRALSDQLFMTPHLDGFVRECVCRQLVAHAERYSGFVPGDYQRYCTDMAFSSTWGDGVTLQAAADYFGLRVMVLSSYESSALLFIEPQEQRSSRTLWISFWAEIHYNSLYHADKPPPPDPDDKLLGSRRLHSLLFGACS